MNRLLKIVLILFGVFAIVVSLYFTFKLETDTSQSKTANSNSSKESQKSQKSSGHITYQNSKTKKSVNNKKSKKQKPKMTTQNNLNTNNYITCGIGIQNCPPPKPMGKCKCNASQSVMTYFDGNH